jgi:ATP-dependent exoDNAse (exonuclease V) beta subunit
VDLAAIVEREIWLLDFKTDHFKPEELPAKVTLYGPQLRLYALALSRIHRRPVTRCWLHFFATGTSEPITI